jgi:hypothetical protein
MEHAGAARPRVCGGHGMPCPYGKNHGRYEDSAGWGFRVIVKKSEVKVFEELRESLRDAEARGGVSCRATSGAVFL